MENTAGSTIIIAKSCDINVAWNCCAPHNLSPHRSAFPHPHSLRRTSCEAELTCECETTDQTSQQRTRMTWTHNTSSQLSVHADYRVHDLTTPCSITHKRTTRSNLHTWARAPLARRSGKSRPIPFSPHAAGHKMMLKRQGHSKSPAKRNMPSKICSCRRIRWPVTHPPCACLCST